MQYSKNIFYNICVFLHSIAFVFFGIIARFFQTNIYALSCTCANFHRGCDRVVVGVAHTTGVACVRTDTPAKLFNSWRVC